MGIAKFDEQALRNYVAQEQQRINAIQHANAQNINSASQAVNNVSRHGIGLQDLHNGLDSVQQEGVLINAAHERAADTAVSYMFRDPNDGRIDADGVSQVTNLIQDTQGWGLNGATRVDQTIDALRRTADIEDRYLQDALSKVASGARSYYGSGAQNLISPNFHIDHAATAALEMGADANLSARGDWFRALANLLEQYKNIGTQNPVQLQQIMLSLPPKLRTTLLPVFVAEVPAVAAIADKVVDNRKRRINNGKNEKTDNVASSEKPNNEER